MTPLLDPQLLASMVAGGILLGVMYVLSYADAINGTENARVAGGYMLLFMLWFLAMSWGAGNLPPEDGEDHDDYKPKGPKGGWPI